MTRHYIIAQSKSVSQMLCWLSSCAALTLLPACSGMGEMGTLLQPAPEVSSQEANSNQAERQQPLHRALVYWGEAFEKDPENPQNALNHANNLIVAGRNEEALQVLQIGMRHNPDHQRLASEYGRLALKLNKDSVAERALKKAEENGAKDWRVISAQGTVFAKQGDHEKAQAQFRKALELAPNEPSVINNLALSYALSGKPAEGEKLLRKVTASGKATDKMKQNMALILSLQGRVEEAKTLVKSAMPAEQAEQEIEGLKKLAQNPIATAQQPVAQKASLKTEEKQKQKKPEKNKETQPEKETQPVEESPKANNLTETTAVERLRGSQQIELPSGDIVDEGFASNVGAKTKSSDTTHRSTDQNAPKDIKAPAKKKLETQLSKGWITQIDNKK